METKNTLLTLIHQAKFDCEPCLNELYSMMTNAVLEKESWEFEWYLVNGQSEADILLLIVLTDMELSIHFHELILREEARYVMKFLVLQQH
ncbi:hypothetical protein AAFX30_06510 [Vibrio chagasii]|uniref:hypothetical protein n=1 Tax=Vibrio chagasii TaxID=170679 RepID=UPI0038CD915A